MDNEDEKEEKNNNEIIDNDDFAWGEDIEELLSRYADESQIREKLHREGYYKQKSASLCYALPIIVCSALSGSIQLLSSQFPSIEQHIITGTATLSIFTSILGSISAYLKLDEKKSQNLQAEMGWQNFHIKIIHTLSLSRSKRAEAKKFVDKIHQEYDRLFEISPMLSKETTTNVKKIMNKTLGDDDNFVIPNYLNGFHHAYVYRERITV